MSNIPEGRYRDDTPDPRDTNKCIVPQYARWWRELGENLGLTLSQLDIILANNPTSCEERCKSVLRKWLKVDPFPNWGKLIDAVNDIQPAFGRAENTLKDTKSQALFASFLIEMKESYKQSRFVAPDETGEIWQLLYPKNFANMLLVRQFKRRIENKLSDIANIMRKGSTIKLMESCSKDTLENPKDENLIQTFETHQISDIFNLIQAEDGTTIDPKMILINGAPGMGKTTLCKEIAFRWAEGLLLVNNTLVILLFLRDPAVQKIYDLKDLVHYYMYNFDKSAIQLSEVLSELLLQRDNSDITIILDGYDEFIDNDNLLVTNILKRKVLKNSKVVITSRPIASEKLQNIADVTVDAMGFTEESRKMYIEQELKDYPEKIEQLLSFLNHKHSLSSVSYIPMLTTLLVYTFKEYDDLPNDESEIIERFVGLTICRFLQKLEISPPETVLCLQDLPKEYKNYLFNLSKFAYETLRIKKYIFTSKDIEQICSNFSISEGKFHGLGLLNFVTYTTFRYKIEKFVFYNFIHLLIQEFLASYYISSLDVHNQFAILKKTFFDSNYANTWVMFPLMKTISTVNYQKFAVYTYASEDVDGSKKKLLELFNNLNLFEVMTGIETIDISNISGSYHILCSKNNEERVIGKTNLFSEDSSTLLQYNSLRRGYWFKIYLSLYSTGNTNNQSIELYLQDKRSKNLVEIAYHQIIDGLISNNDLAVVIMTNEVLLAYRAHPEQMSNVLTMNKSITALTLRNCYITRGFIELLSQLDNKIYHFCVQNNNTHVTQLLLQSLEGTSTLTDLDLNYNDLSGEASNQLSKVIKNNTSLRSLQLESANLCSSTDTVLQALKGLTGIYELNLNNNSILGEAAHHLADVIKNNPGLHYLRLNNTDLQLPVVIALKETTLLNHLSLANNCFSEDMVEFLAEAIKLHTYIHSLDLSNNNLQSSVSVIFKALKCISELKVLKLNNNNIPAKVVNEMEGVFQANSMLENVFLQNNNLQLSIFKILQASLTRPSIEVLLLSDNNTLRIPENVKETLSIAEDSYSHLEHLDLSNNNLESAAIVMLKSLKNVKKLKYLNLSDNNMPGKVADYLADVINNNASLNVLHLSNNNLQSSLSVVFKALTKLKGLKILDLAENGMSKRPVDDLADAINSNTCLEVLDLSGNNLQSPVVVVLKALKGNKTIRILNLSNYSMSLMKAEELSHVLKATDSLQQLSISNNNQQLSLVPLCKYLKQNKSLISLEFDGYTNMSDEDANALANVIRRNCSLKRLSLKNNNLQSSAVVILNALKELKELRYIDLTNNYMPQHVACDLADVVKCNIQLEQLHLGGNDLQSSTALVLKAMENLANLTILDLDDNNMSETVVNELAVVVKRNCFLKALFLGNNNLQSSVCVVLQALKCKSNLQILNLTGNNMSTKVADDLSCVLQENIGLRQLGLGKNYLSSSAITILESLKNHIHLTVVDFSFIKIPAEAADYLADALRNNTLLAHLILNHNDLKSSAVVIMHALKEISTLKVLNLVCNDIPETVADKLAMVIQSNNSIEDLNLCFNKLKSSAIVVMHALQSITSLKSLNLNDNRMTGKVAEQLANAICSNNQLEGLGLYNNDLQTSSIVILQPLKGLTSLKWLNLADNNMSGEVVFDLAEVIKINCNIEEIYLDNNDLQSSAIVVLQALKYHSKLKKLYLNGNNMTGKVVNELVAIISSNISLEELDLAGNNLQSSVAVIIQALTQVNTLQLLDLRDNNIPQTALQGIPHVINSNPNLSKLYLLNNVESMFARIIAMQLLQRYDSQF